MLIAFVFVSGEKLLFEFSPSLAAAAAVINQLLERKSFCFLAEAIGSSLHLFIFCKSCFIVEHLCKLCPKFIHFVFLMSKLFQEISKAIDKIKHLNLSPQQLFSKWWIQISSKFHFSSKVISSPSTELSTDSGNHFSPPKAPNLTPVLLLLPSRLPSGPGAEINRNVYYLLFSPFSPKWE